VTSPQLYVSPDLRAFEADAAERLAIDVTQQDEDGTRVYRRLDARWWGWLSRERRGKPGLAELRERVVALHGAERAAQAEAMQLGWAYRAPVPRQPLSACFLWPLPPFVPPVTESEAA
jgi:hypothetical protein